MRAKLKEKRVLDRQEGWKEKLRIGETLSLPESVSWVKVEAGNETLRCPAFQRTQPYPLWIRRGHDFGGDVLRGQEPITTPTSASMFICLERRNRGPSRTHHFSEKFRRSGRVVPTVRSKRRRE